VGALRCLSRLSAAYFLLPAVYCVRLYAISSAACFLLAVTVWHPASRPLLPDTLHVMLVTLMQVWDLDSGRLLHSLEGHTYGTKWSTRQACRA